MAGQSLWQRIIGWFSPGRPQPEAPAKGTSTSDQEARVLDAFAKHFGVTFRDRALLRLALTHRSYLSVTGQGPNDSNERLEFLGDSVLGLVTSEHLYRANPGEHEGQLTKTKSLLVSKAILSRRALAMGLGRFVLMSHSEMESGGRQRLSILADAFESVIGAVYLDQGFEASREFITRWLLRDVSVIVADKRHTNFKSHLQEYVQSTYRTHPIYRIRSEFGPDHSKQFNVEVVVGKRVLGGGKGRNKKEAEQAAARDALDQVGGKPEAAVSTATEVERPLARSRGEVEEGSESQRGRRGGRGRGRERGREGSLDHETFESERPSVTPERAIESAEPAAERPRRRAEPSRERRLFVAPEEKVEPVLPEVEPMPDNMDDFEEVGRPDGGDEDLRADHYGIEAESAAERADRGDLEDSRPVAEIEAPRETSGGGRAERPERSSSFGRRSSRRRS